MGSRFNHVCFIIGFVLIGSSIIKTDCCAAEIENKDKDKDKAKSNKSQQSQETENLLGHRQLTLDDLALFNNEKQSPGAAADKTQSEKLDEIKALIKIETDLEKPRAMKESKASKLKKAFGNGRAAKYSVQELIDAGVFMFKPVANLHPNCKTIEDEQSVRARDGKAVEVDNEYWGKKQIPANLVYGVMHSTEDGDASASDTIDFWNNDCSAGLRCSSTPFVVGSCKNGPEIYVTANYETRWQRHCSSKLTGVEPVVNWNSIGIEMSHSTEKKKDYTEEEMKEVAQLWTYIQARSHIPDFRLITHGELQGHLPTEHKSFRSDPEGFNWERFGADMLALRKKGKLKIPSSGSSDSKKTIPQMALEQAGKK